MKFSSFLVGNIFGVIATIALLFVRDPILEFVSSFSSEAPLTKTTLTIPMSAPTLGNRDARIVLVEFTDFQCPFCKQFHAEIMPTIKRDWIETGKLRFVHLDLPLDFHASAMPSAIIARCAGDQGKYWELHDALFEKSDCLLCKGPEEIAREAGLDMAALKICKYSNRHAKSIDADIELAKSLKFTGTPSFVLGKEVNGVLTGEAIVGSLSLEDFKMKIELAFENDR